MKMGKIARHTSIRVSIARRAGIACRRQPVGRGVTRSSEELVDEFLVDISGGPGLGWQAPSVFATSLTWFPNSTLRLGG
jgi:hypothetical protein